MAPPMRIPIRCLLSIGAVHVLIGVGGVLHAQTDTNEGIGPSNIEGDEGAQVSDEEARQAERIARDLETTRSRLRKAKRAAAARSALPGAGKSDRRPSKQAAEGARPDDRWRYVYYRGQWWYWLPSESWVYYHDQRWISYNERTDARSSGPIARRR